MKAIYQFLYKYFYHLTSGMSSFLVFLLSLAASSHTPLLVSINLLNSNTRVLWPLPSLFSLPCLFYLILALYIKYILIFPELHSESR
jgi:hypothetical protein